jgi:basic amino acid/polyamine antiporter, APA family
MALQRKLNLFDATMLVVGNVVGAGIFTTAGFVAGDLPTPFLFIAVWVIGGLLTLCGALTYAEMAGMFPRSGGDYLFLKAAYGPWAAFLLGWICFWIINPGSIAILSIAASKYIRGFYDLGTGLEKITALGILGFLSLLNYRGVRLSGTTHNVWTVVSLAIIIFLIASGFLSGRGDWSHFRAQVQMGNPLKLFGPAMMAVVFSYSGWFVTAYIGEEVRRPERNLPLSLILGTCIVMLFYVLLNMVYLYMLPLNSMAGVVNVGQTVAKLVLRPHLAGIVSLAIILAIAASINATILSGARLTYAMSKDGLLWPVLGNVHEKYGVPHMALLCQTVLAGLFIVFDSFENILNSVVFVMLLSSIGSGFAHFVLRHRMPQTRRPYQTAGYPVVPALFASTYLLIAVQILISSPIRPLVGILITLSGLPLYFWIFRGREILDVAHS